MRNKERERKESQLKRQAAKRDALKRILLGCEGKTEELYFSGFRQAHKISNIYLHFTQRRGNDPSNLYREVVKKFEDEGGYFDFVFCVFDRDEHPHFLSTLQTISEKGWLQFNRRKRPIQAITSDPSFDFWLLLHFEDVRAPLHRHDALRRLEKCCPRFTKGGSDTYNQTCAHLETAIARAAALENGKNPSTDVGKLVLKLRELWKLWNL